MQHLTQRTRLAAAAVVCLTGLMLAGPPALSAPPHQVDPGTVSPPLNPNFSYSCFTTGKGITCKGSMAVSYNEPIGLACDGQDVWISGSGRESLTRWHNSDGAGCPATCCPSC